MKQNRKILAAAAAGAALAVAGGGAAVAATDALTPEDESAAVIDDAAKQLGVEPSALSDALRQALKNRIDEAVDAGRITEEQADALKERIDSQDTPLLLGGLGHGPGHGHFGAFAELDAASSYLGLTETELRTALSEGKSLAEIAKDEGKSVEGLVNALVDAASARLDQAVEDGRLTRSQADEIEADLEKRITELVNRQPDTGLGPMGHGFRHDFGPGSRFGGAPHAGPRA
jgi:polyhydroxyalkanoate synthesis regulator phasin